MRSIGMSLILLFLFPLVYAEKPPGLPPEIPAPLFALKDASDKVHELKALKGKLVFLIMGNRKLRKADDLWAEALVKHYPDEKRLAIFIVADMRSVPRFIPRALIRSQLRRNKPPVTLLLDWGGETHTRYRTKLDRPNLFLIGPDGDVEHYERSEPTEQAIQKLLARLDARLTELPPEPIPPRMEPDSKEKPH